ncbi:polysaccharide biosynthesis C-terminal domain-containing protein, partial [candidate division KSB1 bacterium]|nr:polysaccharide biosynthesis C-terminal domain-containing protein [candidate division KSB1 bacterium]
MRFTTWKVGLIFKQDSSYLTAVLFRIANSTKNQTDSQIVGGVAVLNIILNILLIPKYGMMGAVYATVFAQFIALFVAYRVVQIVYPVKYEINRILILF